VTSEQVVELLAAITALTVALHALGAAANPWVRALLSILPLDVIGAIRRAKGKAGAATAPNIWGDRGPE